MLDNVSHTDEIYRFKNIINNYDKSLIILKKKLTMIRINLKIQNYLL